MKLYVILLVLSTVTVCKGDGNIVKFIFDVAIEFKMRLLDTIINHLQSMLNSIRQTKSSNQNTNSIEDDGATTTEYTGRYKISPVFVTTEASNDKEITTLENRDEDDNQEKSDKFGNPTSENNEDKVDNVVSNPVLDNGAEYDNQGQTENMFGNPTSENNLSPLNTIPPLFTNNDNEDKDSNEVVNPTSVNQDDKDKQETTDNEAGNSTLANNDDFNNQEKSNSEVESPMLENRDDYDDENKIDVEKSDDYGNEDKIDNEFGNSMLENRVNDGSGEKTDEGVENSTMEDSDDSDIQPQFNVLNKDYQYGGDKINISDSQQETNYTSAPQPVYDVDVRIKKP